MEEGEDYQWSDLTPMHSITTKDGGYADLAEFQNAMEEECGENLSCQCEYSWYWAGQNDISCGYYQIMYWYHPDYLGNTEYITDTDGEPYQYFWYTPWGRSLKSKHKSSAGTYTSPYQFNGKEHDAETGRYYYGARYYDSKVSQWLSVDPLAHNAPQYSPYAFSFNNPVMFYDPDGRWPYKITFRSFHPSKSFGEGPWYFPVGLGHGYAGDNRSFSLAPGASSRITHQVTADPAKGTLTYAGRGSNGTFSDVTHHPYWGSDKGVPDGYVGRKRAGANSISFLTGYEGTNPLAPGPTPDINVDGKLTITQDGNVLIIKGAVNGDDFPNTEAFIEDPSGQRLFIGKDKRASGYDENPSILFGPSTERIMDINMRIQIDQNNGNFLRILQGMGSIKKPSNSGSSSSGNGSYKNPRHL